MSVEMLAFTSTFGATVTEGHAEGARFSVSGHNVGWGAKSTEVAVWKHLRIAGRRYSHLDILFRLAPKASD